MVEQGSETSGGERRDEGIERQKRQCRDVCLNKS